MCLSVALDGQSPQNRSCLSALSCSPAFLSVRISPSPLQAALQARYVDLENHPVLDPREAVQKLNASLLDTREAEKIAAEAASEDDVQV